MPRLASLFAASAAALFVLGATTAPAAPSPFEPPQLARAQESDNSVLVWDEAVLHGIRATKPGPTIAARALAVAHTAMFDAWAAYDATAVPWAPHAGWRRPQNERGPFNKSTAVAYAGFRAVVDLFPSEEAFYEGMLLRSGLNPDDTSTDLSTPVGVGNAAAAAVLSIRHHDGSNQLGDLAPGRYSDYTGYVPVNTTTVISDPNRWQPLAIVVGSAVVTQSYTTPQWGLVTPFALPSASALRPEGPPLYPDPRYKEEADEILHINAALTDAQKVQAEYFADGPDSEFPPGHWALFAQFVARRDGHTIDDDAKLFFALGNGLLDASICAWETKRFYDYVRPGTAIHFLYRGQPIQGWGGPGLGTVTLSGEFWKPYQLPNVVTPPFPEFFSGHSVFSATGAQILASFTGNDVLGYSVVVAAGTSRGEPGLVPASDLTLSWATFSDAADAAGMSRRYGGIHFRTGDLTGRATGRVIGALAWEKAKSYFDGSAQRPVVSGLSRARNPRPPIERR